MDDRLAASIRQQTFGHVASAVEGTGGVSARVVLLIGIAILILIVVGMFLTGPG
jgi:hypothetical protein